jgi:hypothetical protein
MPPNTQIYRASVGSTQADVRGDLQEQSELYGELSLATKVDNGKGSKALGTCYSYLQNFAISATGGKSTIAQTNDYLAKSLRKQAELKGKRDLNKSGISSMHIEYSGKN